uniref:Uncharacterized protein n=1 Tax=Trypanosoma congolense (strain IL3000) TaxID=1068625 RepID=G0URU5_TRYCI|nr:conserved hypothetical protein [Trypanosoma congolense IL3000]
MKQQVKASASRALRQLVQRLPVGHSIVYLNELSPQSQSLLLTHCFDQRGSGTCADESRHIGGIVFDGEEFNSRPAVWSSQPPRGHTAGCRAERQAQWPTTPLHPATESWLMVPKVTSGQLEAYRAPKGQFLPKPELFILIVPERVFETVDSRLSTEALLQRHLFDAGGMLRWEGADGLPESMSQDIVLLPTWGCTVSQVRHMAELAASSNRRVFLITYGKQRKISVEGMSVQDLGPYCPSFFRSYQVDARSRDQTAASHRTPALLLLEDALHGFQGYEKSRRRTDCCTREHSSRKRNPVHVEPIVSLSVAELVTNAYFNASVSWASVADGYLSAQLFEALHDKRHWCAMDAVLHASQYVVLPFLMGELPAKDVKSPSKKQDSFAPPRIFRWSEIYSLLRWRYFETSFGSMSNVVRPEYVTAVGGGRDPFILPLHSSFVKRVLLPRMRRYHSERPTNTSNGKVSPQASCERKKADSAHANAPGGVGNMATVDILGCFNAVTREVGREPKETSAVAVVSHDRLDVPSFTIMDIPVLAKYLIYFREHFKVSRDGRHVTFDTHDN